MGFVLDPCGIACVIVTYIIVLYSDYVVVFYLILPVLKTSFWAIINAVGFNLVAFLLGFSHLCAVFTDPGIIPLGQYPSDPTKLSEKPPGWTKCNKCTMYRPPRAHHCRVCGRCVQRMDHHCPWINNCVGEYNQKYFMLFLVYVGLLCIYALILVFLCRAIISAGEKSPSSTASDAVVIAHTIVLVAICCLFGLFILAVLSDQYKSIVEGTTAIEALQKRLIPRASDVESGAGHHLPVSKMSRFQEVFGKGSLFLWLLPCHHLFKSEPQILPVLPTDNPLDQYDQSAFNEQLTDTDSATDTDSC